MTIAKLRLAGACVRLLFASLRAPLASPALASPTMAGTTRAPGEDRDVDQYGSFVKLDEEHLDDPGVRSGSPATLR